MILLLAAMPQERDAIKAHMTIHKEHFFLKDVLYEGQIEGKDVLLGLSGIGKVMSAMTLTKLLETYPIEEILNLGSAGGLGEGLHVGDVVISTAGSYHDRYFTKTPDVSENNYFISDKKMRERLLPNLEKTGISCHTGLMISGDQFLSKDTPHYQDVLNYYPDALSVDMESTAIMQVAQAYDVPVLVIRSLSDVPGQIHHEGQFESYLEFASKQSATICKLYLQSF